MRFNVPAFAVTVGLFWGGAILITAVSNLIWPPYGKAFLELAASIYPGYHPVPTIAQAIVGMLYGFVDGVIGGFLFAWIYNWLSHKLVGVEA